VSYARKTLLMEYVKEVLSEITTGRQAYGQWKGSEKIEFDDSLMPVPKSVKDTMFWKLPSRYIRGEINSWEDFRKTIGWKTRKELDWRGYGRGGSEKERAMAQKLKSKYAEKYRDINQKFASFTDDNVALYGPGNKNIGDVFQRSSSTVSHGGSATESDIRQDLDQLYDYLDGNLKCSGCDHTTAIDALKQHNVHTLDSRLDDVLNMMDGTLTGSDIPDDQMAAARSQMRDVANTNVLTSYFRMADKAKRLYADTDAEIDLFNDFISRLVRMSKT